MWRCTKIDKYEVWCLPARKKYDNPPCVFGPTFLVYIFVCARVFWGVPAFWCIERVLLAAVSAVAWWYILQAPSSPCSWYYSPVSGTIPLLVVLSPCIIPMVLVSCCTGIVQAPLSPWFVLSRSTILLSPWWWCGQRCLYDHLSSTDLIAHQPSPVPDRLIVSQEHQFSVLFWTPLPSTIFNHI